MPWDGSGQFSRIYGANGWVNDAATAVNILASRHDTHDQDIAVGIQNAITKDGQSKAAAHLTPNVGATYDLGTIALPWRTLNVGTVTATTVNAATITGSFVSTGVSYVQSAAEVTAGVTPTNLFYPPGTVDRYGTNTTPGTTDMTAAINAAISVASTGGLGYINFLTATYAHASTLIWKNNVVYQGAGVANTILKYTGVSDQIQVNNPINSSTIGNYDIRDMWLQATSANAGKANLADVGSTFVFLRRVRFSGAMIGLILDQTELASITDCLFQDIVANANATGVWLVNGAEHSGGATAGFTNRISFYGCQFNSAAASTLPVLVADDGGIQHKFDSCNFQGGSVQVRLNGCSDNLIQACELEGCGTAAVKTYTTKWGGAAGGVSTTVAIDSCFLASGALLAIDANVASSVWHLRITNNAFSTTSTTIGTTGVVVECLAQNNDQNSSGDNRFLLNNYFSGVVGSSYAVAWTGGGPVVGNGSLSGAYSRKGKEVTIRINLGIGTTTTFGAGAWTFSTPVTSANEGFNYVGAVFARCAGAAPNAGVPIVAPNALTCQIFSTNGAAANWGSATPGAWANGDSVQIQATYKAANWLG